MSTSYRYTKATSMPQRVSYLAAQRKKRQQALVASRRTGYSYVPRTPGGMSSTERKYFDSYLGSTAVTAPTSWAGAELDPATLNCLFVPSEGSDINDRVGRKVSVIKLQMRGTLQIPNLANQTSGLYVPEVRLILYQDMQTNATQAQAEELMGSPGTAANLNLINTFQNTANFGRFRVLKDKTYMVRNTNATWDGTNIEYDGAIIPFKFTIRFRKPVVVRFNATNGGSVADIIDNSFHLIGVRSSSNYTVNIGYQCRTVYLDR